MMPNAFYNDQPIPEADKGFLFSYNKLIGGVLITQVCLCACVLLLVHWCESALACHNVYSTHPSLLVLLPLLLGQLLKSRLWEPRAPTSPGVETTRKPRGEEH